MSKISIVIRCYNEEAHIGRLLTGILQQEFETPEIIVVDSGSTDATLSIASLYPTTILHIDKNDFSFGRSLNLGCDAAHGDFLIFASAHVYPLYSDWLAELIQPFENERIACVYGRQGGNEVTKFSEHQVFSRWFPRESDLNQDHPFCNNANAAVRRSVWEQQRYDETLTGLEDLAWTKKAISAGYRIAYKAEAEVVHVHEETLKQISNRYRREAIAMRAIFPHEKFSFPSFVSMFFKNSFSDARLAAKQHCFLKSVFSIFSFRLMQSWGTFRGYSQSGVVSQTLRQKFYYPGKRAAENEISVAATSSRKRIDYARIGGAEAAKTLVRK